MGLGENRQYKTHLYPVIVTCEACQGVFQYAHLSHAPRHNETHPGSTHTQNTLNLFLLRFPLIFRYRIWQRIKLMKYHNYRDGHNFSLLLIVEEIQT